jgi:hypothetical protein
MNPTFPDSPEAVALELLRIIREAEGGQEQERGRNLSPRTDLLALYAECLARVTGDRAGKTPSLWN